jgi:hypothetical protein
MKNILITIQKLSLLSILIFSNVLYAQLPGGTVTDWDGDGVINTVDLDDDNDGVLDIHEGRICNTANLNSDLRSGSWTAPESPDPQSYGVSAPSGSPNSIIFNNIDDGCQSYTANISGATANQTNNLSFTVKSTNGSNPQTQTARVSINGVVKASYSTVSTGNPSSVLISNSNIAFVPTATDFTLSIVWCAPDDNSNRETYSQGADLFFEKVKLNDEISNTTCTSDLDTDKDEVPDALDLDSDNDGISDLVEAGTITITSITSLAQTYPNGYYQSSSVTENGVPTVANSGSGYLRGTGTNLDSDSDGIPDAIEVQPTTGYVPLNTHSLVNGVFALHIPQDTDNDGTPDYHDEDSDSDSMLDSDERGITISFTYSHTDGDITPSTALANQFGDRTEVAYRESLFAQNDTATVNSGESATISVLANDTYPNGLTTNGLTIVNIEGGGTATVTDNNEVLFQSPPNQTSTTTVTYQICDTIGKCSTATITIGPSQVALFIKAKLLGSLINSTDNLMRDDLRRLGHLPSETPYLADTSFGQFISKGLSNGSEQASSDAFTDRGSNSVVDWVFIQLRDSTNSSEVKETRSALVQRDGDIVDIDGLSPLYFPGAYTGTSYYISIRHRNHLGVMTAMPIMLTSNTAIDFTQDADSGEKFYEIESKYEGYEQALFNSEYSLWPGNANGDNKIKYQGGSTDLNRTSGEVRIHPDNPNQLLNFDNAIGYYNGDIDMDGKVKYQGTNVDTNVVLGVIVNIYPLNTTKSFNYDLTTEQLPSKN